MSHQWYPTRNIPISISVMENQWGMKSLMFQGSTDKNKKNKYKMIIFNWFLYHVYPELKIEKKIFSQLLKAIILF